MLVPARHVEERPERTHDRAIPKNDPEGITCDEDPRVCGRLLAGTMQKGQELHV
jgi:hypothetical protein